MTGGEVVHEVLVRAGVTHVFGVVSVHNLPIYDAIERGGRITPVAMRHEQAAVHAADGYARATGRLGVAVTSTGPGAANGLPGLYEAGFASSPVLMITGQADTPNFGKGRGFVHEADNQAAMLAAVCRRVETVRMRQQIAPALMRVIEDILTGRPQPGSIEIPIDLQYAGREVTPAEQAPVAVPSRCSRTPRRWTPPPRCWPARCARSSWPAAACCAAAARSDRPVHPRNCARWPNCSARRCC